MATFLSGRFNDSRGKQNLDVNVEVVYFEEDGLNFAFVPSLDLTGYGHTVEEADRSLTVVLEEFLKYTCNKKTLLGELTRLGWKARKKGIVCSPDISELLTSNEQLKDIVDNKPYKTSSRSVAMPIA